MNKNEMTRKILIEHYNKYPKLQIQDVFKYLYQSSFGCEHLVTSQKAVTEYICDEYRNISCEAKPVIEKLDGNYCRVHLSYLNSGLSADTLGKIFSFSAKKEIDGQNNLIDKLLVAKSLVFEKVLPFNLTEFDKELKKWENNGYTAISHSDVFKNEYKPSYRVIANEFVPFLPFFSYLDKHLLIDKMLVAIEGGSASGKSTLSGIIKKIYDCNVFCMDDFFLPYEKRTKMRYSQVGGNIDWERFLKEVLEPLSKNETVEYKRFDCSSMTIKDCVHIKPKRLNIIEGAYSMHPMLSSYYDFSLFLDICPKIQKERILKRNLPQLAKRFFDEWIPLENIYFSKTNIKERCNMCIEVL